MAFLLVQHLDPRHESLLSQLLRPCTEMEVVDATQDQQILPNTVLIIPPDTAMGVRDHRVDLSVPTLHRGVRLPVNHLFHSLSREYGTRSVGVVLSGAGSDGSAGLRSIKAAGGLTVAQNPSSSRQSGMPDSAIETGVVDLVLEIPDIPQALERFASLPDRARIEPTMSENEEVADRLDKLDDDELGRLAALLDAHLDFDLRVYKPATVERRVLRRMALSGFDDPDAYFGHLREQPDERQTLVRDLLISVTDFFRDEQAFRALREIAIQPLIDEIDQGETVRVWVPGCATGEEAFSLAIELTDAIEASGKRIDLQIFATDIDRNALMVGRAATYAPTIADRMSQQRLDTYFKVVEGRGYQLRQRIRDTVSFAVHDLTKDPPFSRMHLISCRNVMIYLTKQAQERVLKVLHFALQPRGTLLLGTSESTGLQKDLFATLSKPARLYRKVGRSGPIRLGRSSSQAPRGYTPLADPVRLEPRMASGDAARRAVMAVHVPPTIVVSTGETVIYSHGELSPFLTFPQDQDPRWELSALVRPHLATRTRGALYKCRRGGEGVDTYATGPEGRVRIAARPAADLGDEAVVISFTIESPAPGPPSAEAMTERPADDAAIEQLEKELRATREDLRTTVEELETSNEELRSSNEESMSMNEELQSANEELEATTEELRSLNEELTTVNAQLREKVEQLELAHDDLNNFFSSTKIATIFLDDQLCIKRLTPAAATLLDIDQADTGRAVGNIARELVQNGLEKDARTVLDDLSPVSREIRTQSGMWVSRQVLPYRTENRRIQGVVVTFVDITDLKQATNRLLLRESQQEVIARLGLEVLRESDLQTLFDNATVDLQQLLDVDIAEILEVQPGRTKLLLRAGAGWTTAEVGQTTVELASESRAGQALRSTKPTSYADLSKPDTFPKAELLRAENIDSGIMCPIRVGEHDYGLLGAHVRGGREFSQQDADFLQAMATMIGFAVSRYQTRMRLALELAVANVLAETADLEQTMSMLLARMAGELHSSMVAELWWPASDHEDVLELRLLHVLPAERRSAVEKWFSDVPYQPGEGLVGAVYQTGRAAWASDLGEPSLFVRRDGARALGIVGGLGIPVRTNQGVLGVITLFSTERIIADDVYLRSLEIIGGSIGDFILGAESEQRSRRLAAITEASHDAIFSSVSTETTSSRTGCPVPSGCTAILPTR